MFGKRRSRVLVVGAGPVGLLTACRLADLGVEVQLVDKHRRTGIHSYALALHPRTLRLLDELGVAADLLERGHRVDRIAFYEGTERRAEVDMAALGGNFPYALVLPQRELESALEERLARRDIKVLWNHRLQEIDESGDEMHCEIAKLDQAPGGYPIARLEWVISKILNWKSSFVVGADGFHSMVRTRLGIDYASQSDSRTFGVYEFEHPGEPGNELHVVSGRQGLSVLWPMHGSRSRWSFQIDDPTAHEPTGEGLNRLIAERAPWFPTVKGEIHWSTVVEFAGRLAESFGRGRTWLAGDAAHLTSPVGVQSLNGGIVDGWELSNAIAKLLDNNGPLDSLEDYGRARHREWSGLLGLDDALKATDGADAWVRENASTILTSIPATGDELAKLLQSVGLTFDPGLDQTV